MPIVCINRPNRSSPRRWTPAGLTRVYQKVCELEGPEAAAQAVRRAPCAQPDRLRQFLEEVEDILNGIGNLAGTIIAVTGLMKRLFRSAIWRYLLRYFPGALALEDGVLALEGSMAFLATAEVGALSEEAAALLLLLL